MHIDWVSNAGIYSDPPENILPHITDISIAFLTKAQELYTGKAYGPLLTKILARYPVYTGRWVWLNADNMNMYALAKYVQAQLGNIYPNFPVVTEENVKQPWKDMILPAANSSIDIQWNGTNEIFQEMVSQLNTCADDGDAGVAAATVSMTAMAPASDYPASYIAALVTTQSLTLASPTLSAAALTPAPLVPTCLLSTAYVQALLRLSYTNIHVCLKQFFLILTIR